MNNNDTSPFSLSLPASVLRCFSKPTCESAWRLGVPRWQRVAGSRDAARRFPMPRGVFSSLLRPGFCSLRGGFLSGPGVTAAYSPHAWVSGGTGGTGRWLSSRPTTPCPKEEEPPQKPGSCCAGSEQGDRGIQASWSCRLSRGPVRPQQPPSALPQLRTPSTSFSPCRLRGQSHICGASQLLCLRHHLQSGSPSG